MLLMSSSMFTVLPTPAPPNRPTLPPLANGTSRSMTLMPVTSKILTARLLVIGGCRPVNRQRLGRFHRTALVLRLAQARP